jgi:uncharacterized protein YbaP (TraB family)
MKTSFLMTLSLLMLLSHSPLHAQDAGKKRGGQTSVWVVEGENCKVYLAGSIHMMRRVDLPLPKPFMTAYKDSEELLFEMKPFEDDGAEAQKLSLDKGSYGEGESLKDELTEDGYTALGVYLKESGLPENSMDQFRPWMCSIAITGVEMMKAGVMPDYGVDQVLENRGRKDKKTMEGLETLQEQLALFDNLDGGSGEQMLLGTIEEAKNVGEQFPKMVRAWKNGNGRALLKLSFGDMEDPKAKELYETILFSRNEKWIAPIEKLISGDTNTMVVVGAGHLYGERSVIDLLEKKGYKVKRVLAPEKKGKEKKMKKKEAVERELIPV